VVTTADPDSFAAAANSAGVTVTRIGAVSGAALTLPEVEPISVKDLRDAHLRWFPEYMASRQANAKITPGS
jgi:hypothetical protein